MGTQLEISAEFTEQSIKGFEQYLYERENAEATIEKYLRDVRAFFNIWVMIPELIKRN